MPPQLRIAKMATPATVRQINGAAALALLWSEGPMTRAELARRLKLTKASVTSIIAQLESGGLVRSGSSAGPGKIGRPGTLVGVRPEGSTFIGIEIGVDRMNLVTMDLAGDVMHRLETHGQFSEEPQAFVLGKLTKLYRAAIARLGPRAANVRDVRVTVPGYVKDGGYLIDATILGWREMPLGQILTRRLGTVVKVENDANASAFAEWYLRKELHGQSMYLMLLEAGVGGACIAEGGLALGSNGLAGEIGHARFILPSESVKPECRTGALQDLIGKASLLSSLRKRNLRCGDAAAVIRLLEAKNAAAVAAVEAWATVLGAAVSFVALAYDVQNIVLGGEMAGLFEHIEATVTRELGAILPPGFPPPKLRQAKFIEDGGAVGAAALGHAFSLKTV
jgi:predicted NBD/HSP70 family sugar kinase